MSLPASLRDRLRLPLIAAPMFLVSGPALVTAACRAGVIGSFPTANCRTVEELDVWLAGMADDAKRAADTEGRAPAPWCPNLIVHRSNPRVPDDLAAVLRHKAEIVITSVGSPEPVMKPLKDAGCLVLADVASVRHAEKAVAAGVDGLVLLTAGAGGQTGWVNPFAFVRAVRKFWDGIVVMAGGMADGHAVAAAQAAGLRPRLYGHQVHRHAREPGQGRLQADAGVEPPRRRAADARLHRARRPTCCGRRSPPPASIPTTCRCAAASTSPRTSTPPSATGRTPSAGRTSGAPATRSRASPTCRRSPSWSSAHAADTTRRAAQCRRV